MYTWSLRSYISTLFKRYHIIECLKTISIVSRNDWSGETSNHFIVDCVFKCCHMFLSFKVKRKIASSSISLSINLNVLNKWTCLALYTIHIHSVQQKLSIESPLCKSWLHHFTHVSITKVLLFTHISILLCWYAETRLRVMLTSAENL